jgi:CubicO group peptidase (beta-lactamase class C family)
VNRHGSELPRPFSGGGFFSLLLALAALAGVSPAAADSFAWQVATPESQAMSGKKLDALKEDLAARRTRAFLVLRNDKVVCEWYAAGHGPDRKHGAASLSKATVAGLALAVLVSDGKLLLDRRAADLVAAWNDDPRKRRITLRHLGSHTSGLADAEQDRLPHERLPGWKGDFWRRLDPPNDPFTIARDRTPVLFEPGSKLQYSNPGVAMLGYALGAALKDAPQRDLRTLLRDRVMRPIGAADAEWSIGYGRTFDVEGLPLVAGWGGGSYTARALARIGRLLLREGDWDGNRILSKEAVRQITGDAGLPGHCGMGFWTNADGRYPNLPRDTYYGAGAGDQLLIVVPSLNLIAVRNGEALASEPPDARDVFEAFHDQRVKILFEPLLDAISDRPPPSPAGGQGRRERAPYPASPVITGIAWAPRQSILRKARGSDNWPLTWADDDHQYTAYGDGWGFEPFVQKKLGLGFARIEGDAPHFRGVNVRSPSGEQYGDGARAKKASGILCVEDVLYLWTRNAGNAQLAWSNDHGTTWDWAGWKFTTSFGCPTWLNFGKNYAGARDGYVYAYSHDAGSAYTPADRMVLARVPKGKIRERDAYEFFTALDSQGHPLWSKAIADRGAVFTHAGRCYRSGITYNAGLRRYLWVQILPGTEGGKADTRFEGGFAIYDAPEAWGPWTTVYYTDKWDVGPGESASFPTRWMSKDGKTLQLVFSGDDCFSVRTAMLQVANPAGTGRGARAPETVQHTLVYHRPGRFGGWPANHGIWSWGDEILVGFSAGYYKDLGPERHAIDREKPEAHLLARSRDGGKTWTIEDPSAQGALIPAGRALHGVTPPGLREQPWRDCPGGIDFTHPDFALTVRMTDVNAGPSRFSYSTDRGKTWLGPFKLPLFGQPGIAARTDYLVNGKHDCTLFLTAAKTDGREGRPLCVRTTDGGRTWQFVGWIGGEPKGYAIMPATVRLHGPELLTAIRRREDRKSWIETYRSPDDGKTWRPDAVPVPDTGEGNPASLIRLADGRLCLSYGVRAAPYRLCTKLSGDGGKTWGPEIVLRADGGGRDLGYARSVQRGDGKVVIVYYFWDPKTGPERYIAATIWDPPFPGPRAD